MRAVTSLEPRGKSTEEHGFVTVISLAQATKGSFARKQSSRGGTSSIRHGRWDKPTALGCQAPRRQARPYTDSWPCFTRKRLSENHRKQLYF